MFLPGDGENWALVWVEWHLPPTRPAAQLVQVPLQESCMHMRQSSANNFTVELVICWYHWFRVWTPAAPNTVPWGTPDFTGASSELSLSTTTLCTHFISHWVIYSSMLLLIPYPGSHSTKFFQWVVGGRHKSVEGFGKVEYQEIKLITVIQTSCQVLYCVDELGLAAMQCPKAVLEMHQDLVYVHMVHYASEHNVLEHFAAQICDRAQRDIQISPHHCVGNRW